MVGYLPDYFYSEDW